MKQDQIVVPGLSAPIRITVDQWGIPHIRAANLEDMFFGQGFNAARDRLWQIDLWRKRGLGLLAADFGPGYLEQDRAARLFLYRGDEAADWLCYAPDARLICEAFVGGINAFIDHAAADQSRLPPEFGLFDTRPARWRATDVVRIRSHALTRNALSEVIRCNVMTRAGLDADLLRQHLDPPVAPRAAAGLDIASVPLAVLDDLKLALAPVTFSRDRLSASLEEAAVWRNVMPLGEIVQEQAAQGSNNWVIAGARTETGRPILANDPHRAYAAPGLRYLVHLACPDFDGIGAGEPAVPGIMMGHNGTAAFGLTIFTGPDQEDVYVYETEENDADLYRFQDAWEPMAVVTETFAVKGAGSVERVLRFTRHGPLLYEDRPRRRAYALRTVWSEPGAAAYLACLSTMRAKSREAFSEALTRWKVPAVNQVYADTSGTIAWMAAGSSPIRKNWDGLLPTPGDGRYEWQGFYCAGDLPHRHDPPEGCIATANEQNVPQDWPVSTEKIGFEWVERSRAQRIAEVLGAGKKHSVASSCALQTDLVSIPARRLLRLLATQDGAETTAATALRLLQSWDAALGVESAAAALFEVWWSKHLRPALMEATAPAARPMLGVGDVETVLARLEQPASCAVPGTTSARDQLLVDTLTTAFAECEKSMGADPQTWAWGRLHHGYFEHPATAFSADAELDVGPLAVGGSNSSPMNTGYRLNDFRAIVGASVRMVIDVGGWDNSRCINAPGQSGDPRSPHYADLATYWSRGETVPLLYSAEAIAAAAGLEMELRPPDAQV